MSQRKTILETLKVPCDPGETPNSYVGLITVEVRVSYPPHIAKRDVDKVLERVFTATTKRLWDDD